MISFENSLAFAKKLDKVDPLKSHRQQFNGKPAIYFTGNSLGLQPITAKKFIQEELKDWAELGVEGHIHSRRPWLYYHTFAKKALGKMVGAKPGEVTAMNQLTVNLHLMLVSFYRPTKERFKIITEAGAFSSDQYAFESQAKFHGLNPAEVIVEISPRAGEFTLRTKDIVQTIHEHGNQTALVIFGGVQYYTGQFFKIKEITTAAHEVGAYAGFDLAHAMGNVPLSLHKDKVDFAVWCSYKYLNSGPGSVAGAFVHEKHDSNAQIPRFSGWWGHHEKERFQMRKGFKPMTGVDAWQLSNFPVLSGAPHLASLAVFDTVGMKQLRKKSEQLTGYLEFLLNAHNTDGKYFTIITPSNPKERGCQLSIFMKQNGKKVFATLTKAGIIADWREPNVIRVAPVPLYNTFEDVHRFANIFGSVLK
jgi:kynureninase